MDDIHALTQDMQLLGQFRDEGIERTLSDVSTRTLPSLHQSLSEELYASAQLAIEQDMEEQLQVQQDALDEDAKHEAKCIEDAKVLLAKCIESQPRLE
jgi:hypothetical protein